MVRRKREEVNTRAEGGSSKDSQGTEPGGRGAEQAGT